ncbi:hypothetical protein LCGC14_0387060 [marine sediment metagenome]|uniref:Phosphoadenosine phosphosulphate reductase domain-containing protein n=1 Tax=marine sediment metagenome TaxID=412755 RepID=A0A0F9W9P9_9ZZZZ
MAQLRTFSFGGGVQSTAALVLAAQERIDFNIFLFANVGDDSENPATLRYVEEYAKPYAAEHGIELHELQRIPKKGKYKGQIETVYGRCVGDNRSICIPVRLSNGAPGRRNCTTDFKIAVIGRWQREHGATKDNPAVCGLGISIDEIQRMRSDSGIKTQVLEYPLIDLHLTRSDCRTIIANAGLPVPPKSACWFCPFQRHSQWQDMRREDPELFQRAVKLEQRINDKRNAIGRDRVYLHPSANLLADAVALQYTLFEETTCDSGYCFT